MNNLQTILTAVFLAFFVFAVLIFSGLLKIGSSGSDTSKPQGKIVIWGTFANPDLLKVFDDIKTANRDLIITYTRKPESTYQQQLIEAFASGTGPDLFIVTPDMVIKNKNYMYTIPYASYPETAFRNSFIDGADVYLSKDGIVGFPIVVDPMMLYYNKDILSNEGIVSPPTTWDQLFTLADVLTKRKDDGTVLQSMIALGRYDNIKNSKDILATFFLQLGSSIITPSDTSYTAVLDTNKQGGALSPIEAGLDFFVKFSNPSDPLYSWNRSLPTSINMFTSGKLAFYLGHASELFTIQSVNPNLSFDVTTMPQPKDTKIKRTYGTIYAVAINKKSPNLNTALSTAGILATDEYAKTFSTTLSLPPASRTLLASKPTDNQYLFTFFNSAIISRTWLDPDSVSTDAIFGELIGNILSNNLSVSDALSKAQNQLDILAKK